MRIGRSCVFPSGRVGIKKRAEPPFRKDCYKYTHKQQIESSHLDPIQQFQLNAIQKRKKIDPDPDPDYRVLGVGIGIEKTDVEPVWFKKK